MKSLAIGILVVLATSALAQPKKVEAETAYKAGQALYGKDDYEGAAKQFRAAYDLDPDPVYLFNIAQAYRLAKRCADAAEYYRKFLVEAKKAPNEDVVKQYIVEVDACAKQQAAAAQPTIEPPPVEPQPVSEPPPVEGHRSGGTKRLIGYGVTGAGAIGVGLGFFFMTRVSHWEDVANKACRPGECTWDETTMDKRDDADKKGKRAEKLMVGSWIAGGAAVGAGVFLILTGGPRTERSVAIVPTGNGAMVSLKF
jgi:tetratricopeptide (TPR) repeat protein